MPVQRAAAMTPPREVTTTLLKGDGVTNTHTHVHTCACAHTQTQTHTHAHTHLLEEEDDIHTHCWEESRFVECGGGGALA